MTHMSPGRFRAMFVIFVIVLPVLAVVSTRGAFLTILTVTTRTEPDGLTLYQYTLTNRQTSTFNANGLGIGVGEGANLRHISSPTGWDITYFPETTLVHWKSSGHSTDLLPGASVVFSFESTFRPSDQAYLVKGVGTSGFDVDVGAHQSDGRLCLEL
jgi:hypothetical protein